MAKILLVEDDVELANNLTRSLAKEGHMLETVHSGEDALQMLESYQFEVIILDWSLPGITGLEVCRTFRKNGGTTSVIFLTGHSDIQSKESALDSGGDDYLTKPFESRELNARIRSVLRRPVHNLNLGLSIKGVELAPAKRIMTINSTTYYLTPKECALLEYLMRHPNCAFSADALVDAVWPSDGEGTAASVRSWMRLLRQKLDAAGCPDFIKTQHGSGYIIEQ